ncbi:ras oncogene family protein, putative [Ichthyophthirius multifiliis]|uniref:Ras oncogene family protein, putative n=1 Tax=Ichthyophthirius multifiliis TaxID=5932 RepID=G0QQ17_ICHMU|nr:ras oncogene family protein, putative [Ichthyophthirius multifiliis]EGR32687.1 ras oncogene family protein, putative [Ichthyophthirius multifiliis]|eukprot:XP_004036673.1 ras oncogene family protein, putative [Ichthyophthirius multifiliis]
MNKDTQYEALYKFIIIGNTCCGKTCILHNFLEGKFKKNSSYTIGVEFSSKIIQINNKNIKLQIWDTAGQERFKSVARTYYRGALGAIIVYDITNAESFHAVKQWIQDTRDLARNNISIVVCGNKCDLKDERQVQYLEGERFCASMNVGFFETSAITSENIEQSFIEAARNIYDMIEKGLIDNSELQPRLAYNLKKDDKNDDNNTFKSCSC